jgi:L-histidine N-alpha-methyltransferase
MAGGDAFLIGFDLVKDAARLEAAYDDAAGVTAQFNLNVLSVLNAELEGDFRLEDFEHRAIWNPREARMEMSLVARRPVRARLAAIDLDVTFEAGEAVGTELSHKYTRRSAGALLDDAGLETVRWDTDPEALFAVALARA